MTESRNDGVQGHLNVTGVPRASSGRFCNWNRNCYVNTITSLSLLPFDSQSKWSTCYRKTTLPRPCERKSRRMMHELRQSAALNTTLMTSVSVLFLEPLLLLSIQEDRRNSTAASHLVFSAIANTSWSLCLCPGEHDHWRTGVIAQTVGSRIHQHIRTRARDLPAIH